MSKRDFDPIHPGEILLEEFLRPLGISQYRLAKDISVPQRRISEIIQGKRSVTEKGGKSLIGCKLNRRTSPALPDSRDCSWLSSEVG
ncbi:MAG: HigA family addiction module antidote protein [Gammaproteobacteria bacterium]|nr:HigA family addiction module antidote protein [Gammaproteobacteria bacterium]MBK8132763.1 HigA family addiction module antidote protein [Gammaproteobacteria bacterium]